MTISRTPAFFRRAKLYLRRGIPQSGTSGFGTRSVSGRSLVPNPAQRTIAFIRLTVSGSRARASRFSRVGADLPPRRSLYDRPSGGLAEETSDGTEPSLQEAHHPDVEEAELEEEQKREREPDALVEGEVDGRRKIPAERQLEKWLQRSHRPVALRDPALVAAGDSHLRRAGEPGLVADQGLEHRLGLVHAQPDPERHDERQVA